MERIYKTLMNHQQVDLIRYIKDYTTKFPDTILIVGCDSQNRKRETVYAVVIGLYRPGKGAHVLYTKFVSVREIENTVRLLNEVWFSVEISEYIKTHLGIQVRWIDIDINNDIRFGSNTALAAGLGIVRGMGYDVRSKNEASGNTPHLTYMSDKIVKK